MARGTKQRKFSHVALPGMGRGHKVVKGGLKLGSAFKNSNASTKIGRTADPSKDAVKAGGQQRSKNTLKRLEMYRQKAPNKRDLHKQLLKPQRIEPDRRWFGNTRVITQGKMQQFREEMGKEVNDPYRVVLKSSKLPMSLLTDSLKNDKMDLLRVESFQDTFGAKKQRKKPKLVSDSLEQLVSKVSDSHTKYEETPGNDKQIKFDLSTGFENHKSYQGHDNEEIFLKGTSKRIWRELYKVVDSSDVLIQVLDARDPLGTRCKHLERNIAKNHPHKHVVLLLNKCDLIPNWATRRWCEILRKEKPTLAFHASVTNPFGKSALIQLLRQFAKLIKDKKQIQVGLIGYPNVGKSSVINTLKKKEVCKSAPIPGETKVWQYIALTKKIYAIDCPGIVPLTASDFAEDTAKVLKGVVRAEKLEAPSAYIDEVVSRVKAKYLRAKYNLGEDVKWNDGEEFLQKLAVKMGKLRKGGEPDVEIAARIVLFDWQRGRIPYFVAPPTKDGEKMQMGGDESEDEKVKAAVSDAGAVTTEIKTDAEAAASSSAAPSASEAASSSSSALEKTVDEKAAASSSAAARTENGIENKSKTAASLDGADPGAADKPKQEDQNAEADDESSDDEDVDVETKELGDIQGANDFSALNCNMPFDDEDLGTATDKKPKQSKKRKQNVRHKKEIERALAMNSDDSDLDPEACYNAAKNAKRRRKKTISSSTTSEGTKAKAAAAAAGGGAGDDDSADDEELEGRGSLAEGKKGMKSMKSKKGGRGTGNAAGKKSGLEANKKDLVLDWDKALEEFA